MRSHIRSSFTTALFAGLLVLAAPFVCRADTSTLTLDIQARAPRVPTAKVRILLELAAAPDPATTITIGATSFVGVPSGGPTPNGDDILITRQPGTNTITIFYTPFSKLANPANFCKLGMAVTEAQTVTMNYTGTHINAFRISSYTVAKDQPDDEGTCGQAPRRIKTLAPILNVTNNTPPLPAAVNKGRLPLDIILVLDKSGSMGGFASGGAGPTKWDKLKSSLGIFTGLWETAESDMTGGSGLELVGDRLGLLFFDSTVTPASITFVTRAGTPGPMHSWQAILDNVNLKSPGGNTAMGPGLQAAIDAYTNNMDAWKNDVTIVLMTDGIQNVPPLVTLVGSNWQLDPPGPPPSKNLFEYGTPTLTVYYGTPDMTTSNMLNGVARQMAGTSSIAGTTVEMDNSFSNALVDALKGNTLSLLDRKQDTLPAGAPKSLPLQFFLDGSVRRSVVTLSWETGRHAGLGLEFIAPGGATVPAVNTVNGPTWLVQSVEIPASGPIGEWGVRVVRKPLAGGPTSISPAIPYNLSVYSVEGKLEYRLTFPTVNSGTGDTMVLAADVSYEGKALTKLPAGAIKLRIERPPLSIGNILHDTTVSSDVLGTEIAGGGDTTTPYDRKLAALEKSGKLRGIVPQDVGINFTLEDDGKVGTSGDKTAGDSVYSARFADTSRPGVYRYRVTLDWDDPRTGRIHRIETIERVVKVVADPRTTQVTATTDNNVYFIKIIPRDRFGNFYGPSSANPIAVKVTGGGVVSSITDSQQIGEYTARLENVPPGTNPQIIITVDDTEVRNTKLSDLLPKKSDGSGTLKVIPVGKWAVFFHGGANFPHSNFNNFWKKGFSFNTGLEYTVTDYFSVEGIFGYHRFNGKTIGNVTLSDIDTYQFSANGKFYLSPPGTVRPWVNFGIGAYKFDPGQTRFGGNLGGGLQFNVAPKVALEGAYNYHAAASFFGSDRKFSTLQGGVRFRF